MKLGPLGLWELLIILAVLLLIFGARRLPEIGGSLGRSMRMFKTSVTGEDEISVSRSTEEKPKVAANSNDDLV